MLRLNYITEQKKNGFRMVTLNPISFYKIKLDFIIKFEITYLNFEAVQSFVLLSKAKIFS